MYEILIPSNSTTLHRSKVSEAQNKSRLSQGIHLVLLITIYSIVWRYIATIGILYTLIR